MRVEHDADAGRGIEPENELIRLDGAVHSEAELRRMPEDDPQLRLRYREPLAGANEERDARPPPVVDLQPQRGKGLRLRAGGDAVDVAIPVVLPADVMGWVGRDDRAEQRHLCVLERAR